TFTPLVEKVEAVFQVVGRNDSFYVRTNDKAPRYRLYRVDPRQPARSDWMEIIPEGKDVLENFTVIGETVVAEMMHRAAAHLQLYSRDGKSARVVKLPTLGSVVGLGGEWDGDELLFGFQSFTLAPTVYRLALGMGRAGKREEKDADKPLEKWAQVKSDIDFSAYEVEQVQYPSKDGTIITMFLAHKKGLPRSGQNPTWLNAYGGFHISLTPTFGASRFLFLEQGGLIAIPNLRGGGEYGEEWHQAGMLGKKQNV